MLVLTGLLVVLIAWAIASSWSLVSAVVQLQDAQSRLRAAEQLLRDDELNSAHQEVLLAVEASSTAAEALASPHLTPMRGLPWAGPNLRAASTLSETARDVGWDAAQLLEVAARIVTDERTQEPGEISVEYLTELAPPTRRLVTTVQRSLAEVQDLETQRLLGRLARGREVFLELVEPNISTAEVLADLVEVLPAFVGSEGSRSYLVGAAALSELRGSGGLIGSWTLVTAEGGRMAFEDFVDVDVLPQYEGAVPAPTEEFEQRYARFGALTTYRNANLSPDFPAVAQVLLSRYELAGGTPVDGVIIADTMVFERLAQRAGGIDVPRLGPVPADEVLRFVGLQAYDDFDDDEERKEVLGAIATAALVELFQLLDDRDVISTFEMLSSIARDGHLRVFVVDEEVQAAFDRAGVAGRLPAQGGESVGVFVNNFAESKIDFFGARVLEHHVRLEADGWTSSDLAFTLRNLAPTEGYSRVVLGPWLSEMAPGENRSLVTFSCGVGCEVKERPVPSRLGGTERGRTMVDEIVVLPPGGSATLAFATSSPAGWRWMDGSKVVDVQHIIQPTINGADVRLAVEIPEGFTALELPPGAEVDGNTVVWEGRPTGSATWSMRFDPSR